MTHVRQVAVQETGTSPVALGGGGNWWGRSVGGGSAEQAPGHRANGGAELDAPDRLGQAATSCTLSVL